MKLYSIRPLVWEPSADTFKADAPGVRYCVFPCGKNLWIGSCYSEQRDKIIVDLASLETAKAHCEAHWQQTLSACLEESQEVERLEHAKFLLGQIIGSLPSNRDWLDPDLERAAKSILSV